ncbi:hypothetical protein lerEdw1_019687 [Lerista edwardsae]|nr:hypothetical protein lerEdw1_019687 [Lerista edwardsae]
MWVLGRSAARLLSWAVLLPLLVQASLLPYAPQTGEHCLDPNREYYEETTQKCCSLCPPGSRRLERCTEDTDTQCGACGEETYMKSWNRAHLCMRCSPQCRGGLVPAKECARTQNRLCWCPSRQFCSRILLETCIMCQSYQRCKKGYGVSVPGTDRKDVECAPCSPGTFSDVESHNATCRAHRICQSRRVPGNGTHDAVCHELDIGVDTAETTPPSPGVVRSQPPPLHSLTSSSTLDTKAIQQPPELDVSSVAGLVAGVMFGICALLAGTIFCSAFCKKVPHCVLPFGNEKQPLSSTEKASGKWPQDSGALGQEEQNLLQISTSSSGSWDSPSGSEKSSELIEQLSSGRTHVNISCVVNVCSSDHSLPSRSLDSPTAPDSGSGTLAEEDLPLSKEESPLKREPRGQMVVEVEKGHLDLLDPDGGKPLPLSIQDVGMKTR